MPRLLCFVALLSLVVAAGGAAARDKDQIPPANARPLSEIVRVLESEGHTVIPEIRFDDWVWIARVYRRGLEHEIRIDPLSGEILESRPR
jgi:hypothetical protein